MLFTKCGIITTKTQMAVTKIPTWVYVSFWVAGIALLFALADFGMAVYDTVTINKWDDCTSSNCVSEGCFVSGCIKGKCVSARIEGCCEGSADCAAQTPSAANYTLNSLRVGSSGTTFTSVELYQYNITLYGPWATNQTTKAVIYQLGNEVSLEMYTNVSAASTLGGVINADPVVPARFRPAFVNGSPNCGIALSTNGTTGTGCFHVGTDGQVTISSSNYDCTAVFLNGVITLKPFICRWLLNDV